MARNKKMTRSATILESVGHEMKMNPPKILAKTMAKSGVAQMNKQRVAILLSKAKKRGVKVKRSKKAKK